MFFHIKNILDNKNILILGFGREGRSTLDFIEKYITPLSVTIADLNSVSESDARGCTVVSGESYQQGLEEYDVIIKSPGIVLENASDEVLSKLTSQTSLFLKEFKDRTVGITGTKGKSTTTTLIYHVLKESGVSAVLLGNIGIPPLSTIEEFLKEGTVAVFEMSCHQLEYETLSPHISVILNLFEDHLDHYITRENYIKAKRNIYLNQQKDDVFVCNSDLKEDIKNAVCKVVSVGDEGDVKVFDNGFSAFDKTFSLSENTSALVGRHNVFNTAVAWAVASLFGVSKEAFMSALKTYTPLPHRLQYVTTVNDVEYYDDSISTVCQTTIQALLSFNDVSTVLIGGMDRGIDYTELVEFFKTHKIDNVILMYESGERIAKLFDEEDMEYIFVKDLEEAVKVSVKISESGKKCILSPAAASYGYFKNFEHRGDMFCEYLKKYGDE